MVKKEHLNWTDVSLYKFNLIKDFYLDSENTDEDRIFYQMQILFEINPYKITTIEFNKYLKEMKFLSDKIPNMKVKDEYKLGDTTYKLQKKIQQFTVAQWIDFQNFLKNGGSESDNFPNILSVFFLPKGEKEYNENYDIDKVRDDINKNLSIADALAISTFFLNYHRVLLILSLIYTRKKILKMTPLKMKEKLKIRREFRKMMVKLLRGV